MITRDNILEYAMVSQDIADTMQEKRLDGYQNVLIPSRGICPFIPIVHRDQELKDYRTDFQKIIMPFTSDSFEVSGRARSVRRFFVDVYNSHLQGEESKALEFYNYMLSVGGHLNTEEIEKFHSVPSLKKREQVERHIPSMKGDKTIFIDTVVSGLAASTIIERFNEKEMDVYSILLVDKNGEALNDKYKAKLNEEVANERARIIYVSDLFTEDKGPALLGMTSVVFPTMVEAAKDHFGFFPGAGICYDIPFNDVKKPILSAQDFDAASEEFFKDAYAHDTHERLLGAMHEALIMLHFDENQYMLDSIDGKVEEINETIKREGFLDKEKTKEDYSVISNRMKTKDVSIDVTSSHVVQVEFDKSEARRLMREFDKRLR